MTTDRPKKGGWDPKPTPSPFRSVRPEKDVDDSWGPDSDELPDTLPGVVPVEDGVASEEISTANVVRPAPMKGPQTRPSSPRAIRLDDLRKALEELRVHHDEIFPPPSSEDK